MLTVAGRSINEVFRSRLLQLVVTFHGGMQAIGYNWGSFNHYAKVPRRSPDDNSQRHIAASLSRFAGTGGVRGNVNYPFQVRVPRSFSTPGTHGRSAPSTWLTALACLPHARAWP